MYMKFMANWSLILKSFQFVIIICSEPSLKLSCTCTFTLVHMYVLCIPLLSSHMCNVLFIALDPYTLASTYASLPADIPPPAQVVVRSREFRRRTREEAVKEYFYGQKPHALFPFSFDVPFSDVKIYKIGG